MEEVRLTGKTAHISLYRYQSLLEAERKLIDIKRHENEIINIPISQMQAKEKLLDLKVPDTPTAFPPEVTEQEFKSTVAGHVPLEEILAEREKTHGDFKVLAIIADAIKYQMKQSPGWPYLRATQKESLDMIAHKIGRILAGDPDIKDHWDDIAGYAKLIAREIK